MAAIRLLPASVDTPPTLEVNAEYMIPVPTHRLSGSTRAITGNGTADLEDRSIWSAAQGDDGSFTFDASARQNVGNGGASRQWDSLPPAYGSGSVWYLRNAIAQYGLASLAAPMYGRLVNIFV